MDCGVFISQYAEILARKWSIWFSQGDMPLIRLKMVYEIINSTLKPNVKKTTIAEKPHNATMFKKNDAPGKHRKGERTEKIMKTPSRKEDTDCKKRRVNIEEKSGVEIKLRINWPKSNSTDWKKLDIDLTMMLKDIGGSGENKAEVHPNIINKFCL